MKISNIKYYLGSAFESIYKNRLMSVASILTVASCIAIFIFSFCLAINLDSVLENLEKSIAFNVYIDDKVSYEDFNMLYNDLKAIEYVEKVEVVSKEDALKKMEEKIPSYMLEGLNEDNPLPRTFEVYLDNTKNQAYVLTKVNLLKSEIEQKYATLSEEDIQNTSENTESDNTETPPVDPDIPQVSEEPSAQDVLDNLAPKEMIRIAYTDTNRLIVVNNVIRIGSIVIITGMAFLSIVIIMNTIKLTVNSRKREINIMKYVGATDGFIRWPFIIEGVLIGAIGAIIPTVVGWLSYTELLKLINDTVPFIKNIYSSGLFKTADEIFFYLSPISIIFGILIGVIGSVSSIRKHLKV